MKLKFVRPSDNPFRYLIIENYEAIFYAMFDKPTETKLLYTLDDKLIARGCSISTDKFKIIPNYLIQLLDPFNSDVIIQQKSHFFGTKEFILEDSNYCIIRHFGTNYSVFKEKVQVASYHTVSGSNAMLLLSDDNLCKPLLCLLSLYLYSDFGNEKAIDNPPFNFWFQAKKYNKNWKPNSYS